jgi:hypothetical protein
VRCGVHAGVVERRDDDYFGSVVNRAAHHGQRMKDEMPLQRLPPIVYATDCRAESLRDLAWCGCGSHVPSVYRGAPASLARLFGATLARIDTEQSAAADRSFIGREREQMNSELAANDTAVTLVGGAGSARRGCRCTPRPMC